PDRLGSTLVAFDEKPEPLERGVPLLRDTLEIFLHFIHRFRIVLEEALPPHAPSVDDLHSFEYPQVFGDGLACEAGALRQLGDRTALPAREFREQHEPGFI